MDESILEKIYNPQDFREQGHQLVDLLASYLENSLNKSIPVNTFISHNEQLKFWEEYLQETPDSLSFFSKLMEESIHLHHPHYMGHQISPPAPIAVLAGFVSDFLNNGMGVYEMGGPATVLEKLVIKTISEAIGYNSDSDGFLTSGGTLANLTALLTARSKMKGSDVWKNGYEGKKMAIIVSEQAHYCVDRAARIMGLGNGGIIKVPVDKNFRIRTEILDEIYADAVAKGIEIMAIVGSACSTSTGSYDDLSEIAKFAKANKIWFHVDGAHGGAVIFSEKYKGLVNGIAHADSVIIDCHKMMMTPALATALVYKEENNSYATFSQEAQYLFEVKEKEWHNLAKRTFECTKFMMSVKFSSILLQHGKEGIGAFVTTLYDNGHTFASKIKKNRYFELATSPDANIVCYRFISSEVSDFKLNEINTKIRKKVLQDGRFYIVQTMLNGKLYLRNTMMNPFTTEKDMDDLIEYLEDIGKGVV